MTCELSVVNSHDSLSEQCDALVPDQYTHTGWCSIPGCNRKVEMRHQVLCAVCANRAYGVNIVHRAVAITRSTLILGASCVGKSTLARQIYVVDADEMTPVHEIYQNMSMVYGNRWYDISQNICDVAETRIARFLVVVSELGGVYVACIRELKSIALLCQHFNVCMLVTTQNDYIRNCIARNRTHFDGMYLHVHAAAECGVPLVHHERRTRDRSSNHVGDGTSWKRKKSAYNTEEEERRADIESMAMHYDEEEYDDDYSCTCGLNDISGVEEMENRFFSINALTGKCAKLARLCPATIESDKSVDVVYVKVCYYCWMTLGLSQDLKNRMLMKISIYNTLGKGVHYTFYIPEAPTDNNKEAWTV